MDRQRAEVRVVGEHHTAVRRCAPEDDEVRRADEAQLDDGHDISSLRTQRGDDFRVHVLVRQQRQRQRFHAEILRSHIACSRTARDANSSAAWKPSTVRWG
jgi:hypothetical protein